MAEILLSRWKDDKPKNSDFTKRKTATADSFRRRSNKQLEKKLKDLDTADQNVDAILQMQIPEPARSKTKDLER